MSTPPATTSPMSTTAPPRLAGRLHPMLALARMEATVFLRNPTAVINATLLPLGMAGVLATFGGGRGPAGLVAPIAMAMASCLIFVVYFSLVTSVVARRQSGVLKRLLTGTVERPAILAALSLPLLALFVVEIVLAVGVAAAAIGSPPVQPLLIAIATVAAGTTWSLLGLASSIYTRTAESAQITTVPLMIGSLLLSGLSLPVSMLPRPVRVFSELSPLRPITDLTWYGVTGEANPEELFVRSSLLTGVGMELLVLAAWALAALWVLRRFRWEARV